MNQYFYEKQSIITNPHEYASRLKMLKGQPEELLKIVQGLIIHGELGKLYGISFSKRQQEEELLRTVPQMLGKIFSISSAPLNVARRPEERIVGMCRDYAVLMVSFLRQQQIPARVRVGFASYFKSQIPFEDQWVAEYYSRAEKRWIRMEVQVDQVQKAYYGIHFNTLDMPDDSGFLLAGEAWKICRQKEKHPEDFGYNNNWKGWCSIKGNLLHDFNCLMGLELMPWDLWTALSRKKYAQLTSQEKALLDEMAMVTSSHQEISREALGEVLNRLPEDYMQTIHSELGLLAIGENAEVADPDKLEEKIPVLKKGCQVHTDSQVRKDDQAIVLMGGRQNNLKNINLRIPKNKLTVITGVSGSGKSSLAFDTLYAEGKRRYLDNISGAFNMHKQMEKPDFDSLTGLTPTIAIEQKKGSQNPRSTVGTLTGVQDQLRMLYVAIGKAHCPYCAALLQPAQKDKICCPVCGNLFWKMVPSTFNANSHTGACHACNGLGYLFEVDEQAVFKREELSVLDDASDYFGRLRHKKRTGNWMIGELYAIAEDRHIDLELPWNQQPESFKKAVLYGTGENKIYTYHYHSGGRNVTINRPAQGAISHIQRLFREAKTENNPYLAYMRKRPCPVCHGEQLGIVARYTTIGGYRLPQLMHFSVQELTDWCFSIQEGLTEHDQAKAGEIFHEIENRLSYLAQVGLSYLTLNRTAPSLSGGELQRVRLSSQLGSDLVGLTYILDEPSIGLHPFDHHLMIDTMKKLRDKGNTVIVVEHDKETMLNADYIVDVGPGAGIYGGQIVARGTVEEIKNDPYSITGEYLKSSTKKWPVKKRTPQKWLKLWRCSENNLKHIDVSIPLETMCCVTGVSGSGKSTLVFETLIPALEAALSGKTGSITNCESITGYESLGGVIQMDQAPIGKNARSTPVTYLGVFDDIRKLYKNLPTSQAAGYDESYFSFNSKNGQCPVCEGMGQVKVAFWYMSDHYVTCPKCQGKRYREEVLEVKYQGRDIAQVLQMDATEGAEFFRDQSRIHEKLKLMNEVGLGYLKLGQNAVTLSGGEAQRLKLSKELGIRKKGRMLYILDEPTTGLHLKDIDRLLDIFQKLAEAGNSLLIIEHNMEVVRAADWVIDMGPGGGEAGGRIMAEGSPEKIAQEKDSLTGRYLKEDQK